MTFLYWDADFVNHTLIIKHHNKLYVKENNKKYRQNPKVQEEIFEAI